MFRCELAVQQFGVGRRKRNSHARHDQSSQDQWKSLRDID
jgi:hypothetical protein